VDCCGSFRIIVSFVNSDDNRPAVRIGKGHDLLSNVVPGNTSNSGLIAKPPVGLPIASRKRTLKFKAYAFFGSDYFLNVAELDVSIGIVDRSRAMVSVQTSAQTSGLRCRASTGPPLKI